LNPSSSYHLNRAEALLKAKALDLAVYELESISGIESFSAPFLTYLAMLNHRAKNYKNSFRILNELFQRNDHIFSSYHLRLVFPVEFFKIIEENSEKNGLDPILVLSLMKQESAFSSDAYSRAKAMGVMQILLSTARGVDATITAESLLELDSNVRIGTKYLAGLVERYQGNLAMALSAYNAGPSAVDRWIKNNRSHLSLPIWIESIPYKETRNYVSSIIRNYYWYSRPLKDSKITFEKVGNTFWKN
jgi:soluble lytic murein transglycosylase